MENNKKCLWCGVQLEKHRKKYCSHKCCAAYFYYVGVKKELVYKTHRKLIKREWNYEKNSSLGYNPKLLTQGSHKKVFWKCLKGHEWKATINSRTNVSSGGTGCPYCAIKKVSGKNNHNYNPNLTDKEREDRRLLLDNTYWRKNVYARDNYICQICGDNKGGNLNSHHLEGYNCNKKLRFEKSNGITLCKDCHMDFHKKYSYGNNTKAQFEEYKKNYQLKVVKVG